MTMFWFSEPFSLSLPPCTTSSFFTFGKTGCVKENGKERKEKDEPAKSKQKKSSWRTEISTKKTETNRARKKGRRATNRFLVLRFPSILWNLLVLSQVFFYVFEARCSLNDQEEMFLMLASKQCLLYTDEATCCMMRSFTCNSSCLILRQLFTIWQLSCLHDNLISISLLSS